MGNWDNLQKKYKWMTRGENCRICDAMAGRVYTYDTWIAASVLPGFHLHCNCYLQLVGDEVPESDKDIFGSDIQTMLDNQYFLSLNLNPNWQPYNLYLAGAVDKAMGEGLSLREAVSSALGYSLEGVFKSAPQKIWNQFSQWRVFRALKQSIDGTLTNTLSPTVTIPTPSNPSKTYKSTYKKNWD
jgi:hypothetical protein